MTTLLSTMIVFGGLALEGSVSIKFAASAELITCAVQGDAALAFGSDSDLRTQAIAGSAAIQTDSDTTLALQQPFNGAEVVNCSSECDLRAQTLEGDAALQIQSTTPAFGDRYAIPKMTGNTTPSGVCSAWREGGQFTIPNAWKAFDRLYDDPYTDSGVIFTAYGSNAPVIIQYQTQCFTTFTKFEVWLMVIYGNYVTEKWRDFTFETSDDGANWTVRKTVTNATWIEDNPAFRPHNTFTLDAEVTAKFVRWVVTRPWDASVNSLCLLKECRLLLE